MSARLFNRAAVTVSTVAIEVAAASPTRKKLILQQTSANPVRIGAAGVTATTGIALNEDEMIVFEGKDCPTEAIYAIREGGADGVVVALELADV